MGDGRLLSTSALALRQGGGVPCAVRVGRTAGPDRRAPQVLHELDPHSLWPGNGVQPRSQCRQDR